MSKKTSEISWWKLEDGKQFSITEVWVDKATLWTKLDVEDILEKALTNIWTSRKELFEEMAKISQERVLLDSEIRHEAELILGGENLYSFLEKEIKKYFESSPHMITEGSEWMIYTMNIPGQWEVVVIKKVREHLSKNNIEYENHYKFKELEIELDINGDENIVKIPTPIHHFNDWNSEYIVMEYIPWKTLYTMILEKLVEEDALSYLSKINNETDKKDFLFMYYQFIYWETSEEDFLKMTYDEILSIITGSDWYIKSVSFDDDTKAEQNTINIYTKLRELRLIDWNPMLSEIDENWNWINSFLNHRIEKIMWEKWLWVFSQSTWKYIQDQVLNFLKKSHDKNLYHMDLWWNPRNIMFVRNSNQEYIPYIIDFWKSECGWEWSYENHLLWGTYVRDENINLFIKNSSSWIRVKLLEDEKLIDLNDCYEIWKKIESEFGIKIEDEGIKNANIVALSSKNIIYYNSLINILKTGYVRWYKLNLWKNWDENDNSWVLAEIIVLMFYVRDENFWKILDYIDNLKRVEFTWKKIAIPLYKKIYEEVKKLRKG